MNTNYTFLLDGREQKIFDLLSKCGITAYAVGGFVRDIVMGRPRHDLDIAVSTIPSETKRLLSPFVNVIETGVAFGTVTAVVDGAPFELTTFRSDIGIGDGRHPNEVEFVGDIYSDLARRDFTVNAMAWSRDTGIIDIFDGVGDAQKRIIRTVGDPFLRFAEDVLRILRALRFAAVLDFDIHEDTDRAIHEMANRLKDISAERIFAELSKMLSGVGAGCIISRYKDVLASVIPCFSPENAECVGELPYDLSLRFASLFKSADDALTGMSALKPPKTLLRRVVSLLGLLPLPSDKTKLALLGIDHDDGLIYDASLIQQDKEITETVMNLRADEGFVTPKTLDITSLELMSLGISEGPAIGKAKRMLCEAVARGKCDNNKNSLKNFILIQQTPENP